MKGANLQEINDDLVFFGKINASISHELKNILAIISEAAGLLNDLTGLAASGGDIQLEMLQNCSRDIVDEIQRGFVTIKQMNTFSHSVDDPLKDIDMADCIELMTGLAGFLSFACSIQYEPPKMKMPATFTSPFRLQNLIYQTLVFAFKSVGPGGEISLALYGEKDNVVRICFSGIGSDPSRLFPTEDVNKIAASIGARFQIDDSRQTIDILVPSLGEAKL